MPDVETYLKLRESAGMRARTHSGASKGLGSELFSVILRLEDSGEAVGMGRVVGDGGTVFHICDMAVSRDWQGKGGGSMIMDSLMGYISREATPVPTSTSWPMLTASTRSGASSRLSRTLVACSFVYQKNSQLFGLDK